MSYFCFHTYRNAATLEEEMKATKDVNGRTFLKLGSLYNALL